MTLRQCHFPNSQNLSILPPVKYLFSTFDGPGTILIMGPCSNSKESEDLQKRPDHKIASKKYIPEPKSSEKQLK